MSRRDYRPVKDARGFDRLLLTYRATDRPTGSDGKCRAYGPDRTEPRVSEVTQTDADWRRLPSRRHLCRPVTGAD